MIMSSTYWSLAICVSGEFNFSSNHLQHWGASRVSFGSSFFTLYISPLAKILSNHGISHQQFADDTQLFIAISPTRAASKISQGELCLTDLHAWFCCNGLALNADKSDCIILGVTLDSHLTFEAHVKSLTKTCYFHIRALRHIRSSIDLETAKSVANAIVSSRLDYANSLLYGISGSNMLKLQRVQNSLARVILATTHTRTDNALHVLHWLPIHHRISFKIASLTYKILNSKEPSYLADLLSPYVPARTLRSSNSDFLVEPMAHTVFGSRAFRSAAPKPGIGCLIGYLFIYLFESFLPSSSMNVNIIYIIQ